MHRLIDFVTRRPKLVITFSVLVVALLALPLPRISINSDMEALISESDPDLVRMHELEDIFGGLDVVIITYHSEDVFAPASMQLIHDLSEEILDLAMVDRVYSLSHYESIRADEDMMTVDNFMVALPRNQQESDSLATLAFADEMIPKILVSADRRYAAFLVFPIPNVLDGEIRNQLETVTARYNSPGNELEVGGMPIIRDQISLDIAQDTGLFIPLGVVLITLLLFLAYRSRRGVLLPMLVVLFSIAGTLGLMTWLNMQLTVISSIIPVMLIAVASAYGIHIITRYYEDHRNDPARDRYAIVAHGMRHLAKPIFMAALTTMIGFLSLLSHVLPASKQVGLLTSFGVLLAFLLSITFIPACLVLFPRPRGKAHNPDRTGILSRFLAGLGGRVYRHRKIVIYSFVVLAVLAVLGIPRVIVDSNPLNYYDEDSRIRRTNAVIDEYFGGSTTLSVIVEGDIKSPAVLEQIEAIQAHLAKEPIVGYTLSINDFIKSMNQAMHGGDPTYDVIPENRELVSQYLLLYSWESTDSPLDSYVDYDYGTAQIVVRLNTLKVQEMIRLKKDLNQWLDANIDVENQPRSEGYAVLLANLIPQMLRGQTRSLIISVILLGIVTGLIFRSFAAAVIASIPLAFAISVVFGLMGYLDIHLTTATSMISSIMIGIGIDYTIHFLFRFRTEVRSGYEDEEALRRTISTTGQGIVINAVSVMVGFAVCMFSSFIPIYFFGWLIVVSIGVCLIASLTLLPVILLNFRPRFIYDA